MLTQSNSEANCPRPILSHHAAEGAYRPADQTIYLDISISIIMKLIHMTSHAAKECRVTQRVLT
jgi:hypothetical protein